MAMDHLKIVGSQLLIYSNAHELLKAWEDERTPLWHSPICIEMFLESITIGFVPERFAICISSVKEWIDQAA